MATSGKVAALPLNNFKNSKKPTLRPKFPLLYGPHRKVIVFQRSSAVEQLTVNQLVVGSIPTAGANSLNYINMLRLISGVVYFEGKARGSIAAAVGWVSACHLTATVLDIDNRA